MSRGISLPQCVASSARCIASISNRPGSSDIRYAAYWTSWGMASRNRDRIANANQSIGEDLGPQATLVDQTTQDLGTRLLREIIAGLAQPDAADADRANGELASDELIEPDAIGDNVATG